MPIIIVIFTAPTTYVIIGIILAVVTLAVIVVIIFSLLLYKRCKHEKYKFSKFLTNTNNN